MVTSIIISYFQSIHSLVRQASSLYSFMLAHYPCIIMLNKHHHIFSVLIVRYYTYIIILVTIIKLQVLMLRTDLYYLEAAKFLSVQLSQINRFKAASLLTISYSNGI